MGGKKIPWSFYKEVQIVYGNLQIKVAKMVEIQIVYPQ